METIKYVGFYDTDDNNNNENRNYFLSGRNKMKYVIQALNEINYRVELISPSWTKNNNFYKSQKKDILKFNELILCPTIPRGKFFMKLLSSIFSSVWLFIYLIIHTKKEEKILVYHSINLIWPIKYAQKVKKFLVILELEEIYSEVWLEKSKYREAELKFINSAESLIVVSDKLKDRFRNKKSVVLYGEYKINDRIREDCKEKGFVNIVYAGVIEKRSGSALNAIQAMEYLPKKYRLYILGYGSEEDIKEMKMEVEKMNLKKERNCCSFEGAKTGKEYTDFLFKCDMALNPQKVGSYMGTAFPSKILSYLSNDLLVVSTKIESIVNSKIASYIYFSENDSPLEISKAILKIKLNEAPHNSKFIKNLHEEFKQKFKIVIES